MSNMFSMMKQAKEMQSKMKALQEEIAQLEAVGQAGGGYVQVTINGNGLIKNVEIDNSLIKVEEKEILEDLLVAAYNEGKTKLDTLIAEKTQSLTEGLPIPPNLKSLF